MLHPTMLDDVGPAMLASFEQALKVSLENRHCFPAQIQDSYHNIEASALRACDHFDAFTRVARDQACIPFISSSSSAFFQRIIMGDS